MNPVVCSDEKPVVLIGDKYETTFLDTGKIAQKGHKYSSKGSANVFCAVEPLAVHCKLL